MYQRKSGDNAISEYDVNSAGRILRLDTLGPQLDRRNTFGCYISPRVTRHNKSGELLFAAKDSYPAMFQSLLNRLEKYLHVDNTKGCLTKIIIYEGEIGSRDVTTSEALWYGPVRDEQFYKEVIDDYFSSHSSAY